MQRYHVRRSGAADIIDYDAFGCTDDACAREHVWVISDAEYAAGNAYILRHGVDHIGAPDDSDG